MKRSKTSYIFIIGLLFCFPGFLFAQSSFALAEELFMQNRPQEALRHLEAAVAEDPAHVQAFLYLGIVYIQLNRLDDAIRVYEQILPRSGFEAPRIAFNIGNAHFMKGDHALARIFYSQAIDLNPRYASAYLNRANSYIRTGDLVEAMVDYQEYLVLDPGSDQREPILRLISFIREEQVAAERLRIMQEEAARTAAQAARMEEERMRIEAEEAARIAAEEARLAAERRRLLLEEVNESLQAVGGDSRSLWAGTEDLHEFSGDFELD